MDVLSNNHRVTARLKDFNLASQETAFTQLTACCSSMSWAQRMVAARPFVDLAEVLEVSERIWWELRPSDWLEAFAGHPRIGEHKANQPQSQQAAAWSVQEQAGVAHTSDQTLRALTSANQAYEARFGYIYIVCATGKSSEELLAFCQERLKNADETELLIAAREQQLITALRVQKMFGGAR